MLAALGDMPPEAMESRELSGSPLHKRRFRFSWSHRNVATSSGSLCPKRVWSAAYQACVRQSVSPDVPFPHE